MPATVTGSAVGAYPVKGDRGRAEGDEHRSPVRFGDGDLSPLRQLDAVVGGGTAVEVEADEAGDVVGARVPGDLAGRPRLHQAPVFDDDQAVGEDHRVERVMGDQQGGAAEVGEVVTQPGADLQTSVGVEGRERFVEQQQPGRGCQRAGEGDALGLAAG